MRPITPDYDRQISAQVSLSGGDAETQRDLLSDQIPVQVLPDWCRRPGRTMTVKVIETIRIHD